MEDLNQAHGFVLYSANITAVTTNPTRQLFVEEPRDYVNVLANGEVVGSLDRSEDQFTISVPSTTTRVDLLVEAMGHINYDLQMNDDRKGITE